MRPSLIKQNQETFTSTLKSALKVPKKLQQYIAKSVIFFSHDQNAYLLTKQYETGSPQKKSTGHLSSNNITIVSGKVVVT